MDPELEERYFLWLCNKVESWEVPTPSVTHWELFRALHSTEFVWIVPWDDNRAADGVALRPRFFVEQGGDSDEAKAYKHIPCSLLEMFIAFAERIPDVVNEHFTSREWFWEMMHNLRLDVQNDASFDGEYVAGVLDTFVWRLYNFSGNGSAFPLFEPTRDIREVDLWYQLFDYVKDRRRYPEWHRTM